MVHRCDVTNQFQGSEAVVWNTTTSGRKLKNQSEIIIKLFHRNPTGTSNNFSIYYDFVVQ